MRRQLINIALCAFLTHIGIAAPANTAQILEQDIGATQLVFRLVELLETKTNLDREIRSIMGSSLEFAFLQLERSNSAESLKGLARTAVLRIDAGGGESRTAAIVSKGRRIVPQLSQIMSNYDQICGVKSRAPCMPKAEAKTYIEDMISAAQKSGKK